MFTNRCGDSEKQPEVYLTLHTRIHQIWFMSERETTTSSYSFKSILEPNYGRIVMSSALPFTNHPKLNFSAELTHCQSWFDSIVTIPRCQSFPALKLCCGPERIHDYYSYHFARETARHRGKRRRRVEKRKGKTVQKSAKVRLKSCYVLRTTAKVYRFFTSTVSIQTTTLKNDKSSSIKVKYWAFLNNSVINKPLFQLLIQTCQCMVTLTHIMPKHKIRIWYVNRVITTVAVIFSTLFPHHSLNWVRKNKNSTLNFFLPILCCFMFKSESECCDTMIKQLSMLSSYFKT